MLAFSGIIAATHIDPTPDQVIFIAFSILAVLGGVFFLTFRQPVHSALGFAVTVLATCGLFFLQSAPFLAAATMMVYAALRSSSFCLSSCSPSGRRLNPTI